MIAFDCPMTVLAVSSLNAFSASCFEDVHVIKWPKAVHGYRGSMGDIIKRKDGSMLMSYTENGIRGIKSTDQGKTWDTPFTLVADPLPPAKGYYCHPGFLRLCDDHILLSYIYSTHPTTPYYGHNYYRRSADEGETWTEQFVMTPHPGYVLVHNDRLFTLKTGRIVALAEYKAYRPSTDDHGGFVGLAFYSDDNGYNWQVSKNAVDMQPIEVQEAGGVELRDGRVMMFARTYSGHPVRAYSNDGCETWSKGEEIKELVMPYAGLPTVKRLPTTGDLLFIWISERSVDRENPQVHRRCALMSAISKDEGQTFIHCRNLRRDPEDDFGYQCVEFISDEMVLLGYHARDGIHVARLGIDWFYGED